VDFFVHNYSPLFRAIIASALLIHNIHIFHILYFIFIMLTYPQNAYSLSSLSMLYWGLS